jgi:raffinose/stachyose/melibiose transport system substrate-binding protein
MIQTLYKQVRAYFALGVVLIVFAWSAFSIASRQEEAPGADTIVLRLGHWQLEPGARAGIEALADQYAAEYARRWKSGGKSIEGRVWSEVHPDKPRVKIIQDAVPEAFYGQWVSAQVMGGQAPDLMEIGLGGQGLIRSVWISYLNRYFLPLTPYVGRPNPHNEGSREPNLEGVPLRKTYKDAMRGGYVEELQEFYGVPVAQFVVRIFYNADLLKKLTRQMVEDHRLEKALDKPPEEFRAFIDLCRKIREYKDPKGKPYTAIASSGYHTWMWEQHVCDLVTPQIVRRVDTNHDGLSTPDEFFAASKCGRVGFSMPQYQARLTMLRDLCENFQNGFAGLIRDDAVFLFAQQRAVFIATGTWDARSLLEQAKDVFEVGLMDFPIPAADDKEFGPFIEGRRFDNPITGAVFGVTRNSQYADVALDFLLYVASQKGNEEFNKYFGWVPAILGAKTPPDLVGFVPHFDGVQIIDNMIIGGDTWLAWDQEMAKFRTDADVTPKQVAALMDKRFRNDCDKDWVENQMQSRRRGMAGMEVVLAGMRLQALEAEAAAARAVADPEVRKKAVQKAEGEWVKYRVLTTTQEVNQEILTARQLALFKKQWIPANIGLSEHTPQAIEAIRRRASAAPPGKPGAGP